MRWNAVNYFFHRIHRFHRISYIILPQKLMRWIFVRNAVNFAVNFCNKCAEMRWNIYFHRIHRIHRISYKICPKTSTRVQTPRPLNSLRKSTSSCFISCQIILLSFTSGYSLLSWLLQHLQRQNRTVPPQRRLRFLVGHPSFWSMTIQIQQASTQLRNLCIGQKVCYAVLFFPISSMSPAPPKVF